jgi:hypothetical protein
MLKEKKEEKNKEKNNLDSNEFKTEDGYPVMIEINLTESEEKYFFTERYDNLSKKNNELIKKKIEKQEELRNNIININIDWNKLINDNIKKIYGNINSAVDLIKKFLKENPKDRWGDKNLNEIKNHEFFEGFNWNDIENIKNDTIKEYVKKRTIENNNKIKKRIKEEKNIDNNNEEIKTEDGYPIEIEINLTENEEKYFFTERYDNLNKKNNEYIKKKIEKEANLKENISDLMLIDLE